MKKYFEELTMEEKDMLFVIIRGYIIYCMSMTAVGLSLGLAIPIPFGRIAAYCAIAIPVYAVSFLIMKRTFLK